MAPSVPTDFIFPNDWPWQCIDCGRNVPITLVKSNKHGNQGRKMVRCKNPNKNVVSGTCDYIRWVERRPAPSTATSDDDPFPSSSSAPSLTSTPSLASTWQAPPFSASLIEKCRHITRTNTLCKSTRVLPNCGRGMCRKHCMESGGCLGKGHLANGSLRTAVAARIVGTPLPSQRQPDPPRRPVPTTSASDYTSTPATATQPEPNSDGEADPTWDARFVSHMPDVFNRQYATQQRLQEKKWSEDEERLRSKKKADETVIGYAFVEDDREAVVAMFQNNTIGKLFTITHDVLVDLELSKADTSAIDQAVV